MKSARHRLRPANDYAPYALQKMSRVALPRRFWNGRRVACVCILAVFVLILGAGLVAALRTPETPKIAAKAVTKSAPYDLRIDAANLAAPDAVASIAAALPPHVTITKHGASADHPEIDITVQDEKPSRVTPQQMAANFAALAHNAMMEDDGEQALRFQRRAVAAAPDDMRPVLVLAIMLDRAGDQTDAIENYQRVVDAYDAHDKTAPPPLKIGVIRRRLAYLVARIKATE